MVGLEWSYLKEVGGKSGVSESSIQMLLTERIGYVHKHKNTFITRETMRWQHWFFSEADCGIKSHIMEVIILTF